MNTDELIEKIHQKNAEMRRTERSTAQRPIMRLAWHIAVPGAAAAAILLLVLLPQGRTDVGSSGNMNYASAGIYCNSQCNPDDVLALIDNNINHIRTIQSL